MKSYRSKILAGAALSLLVAAFVAASASQTAPARKASPEAAKIAPLFKAGKFHDARRNALPYRYFEPPAAKTPGGKYPVILYLHGEEEAGADNAAQITRTECATVWAEPDHVAANPAYVLAPQLPRGAEWAAEPAYSGTLALLKQFMQDRPAADPNRIYVVGFSKGADGLWNMILKNPKLFAAAMPIAGNADAYLGDYDAWAALKNMPIVIVHSYDDTVSPISGALNAVAALRAAGNNFVGAGGPTPCLWSPGSTPVPHDAWWTAFHKFEVVYNSLFLGDLGKTKNGEISPTTLYVKRELGNGITQIWDYALGTAYVIERSDKAVIIDATMGQGSIYRFIRDEVLKNKDIDLELVVTHQHNDHIRGLGAFVGAAQLKKVYVHKDDSAPVIRIMGPDAGKVTLVKDGDTIALGGKKMEIIGVPGHSWGCLVMMYEDYLFAGDSIGTGYVGVSQMPVEQFIGSVQHLLDRMGARKFTILGGHTGECRGPMTEKYVHELMSCARGLVAGKIIGPPYWRGGELSTRKVATVGGASITYAISNVRLIKAALRGLEISAGTLSPAFAAYNAFYSAQVDRNTAALAVTPTVMAQDYKSLAVNGVAVRSGEAHRVSLAPGDNRLSIVVTAAGGETRTYTLNVQRAER